MGFSRQEYWSGLPFPSPRDLPNPGIEPRSPALQADALTSKPQGKPTYMQGRWGAKLWCLEGYVSKCIFSLESSADDRFIRCKYSWCFSRKKVSVPYLALVFLLPVGAHTPLWFSLEQFPPLVLVQFDIRNKIHVLIRHLTNGELLLSSRSRWRGSQLSGWAATVLGSFLHVSSVWAAQCVRPRQLMFGSWRASYRITSWKADGPSVPGHASEIAALKWYHLEYWFSEACLSFIRCDNETLYTVRNPHGPHTASSLPTVHNYTALPPPCPFHVAHCCFSVNTLGLFSKSIWNTLPCFYSSDSIPQAGIAWLCGWQDKWCLHMSSDENVSFRRTLFFAGGGGRCHTALVLYFLLNKCQSI